MRRLLALTLLLAACSTAQADDTEYTEPVSLTAHDDTIWVVERGGRVVSVNGEVLIDLNLDLTEAHQEAGLLSVEFWEGGYWLYLADPDGVSELWSLPYGATGLTGEPLRSWGPAPWHFGGHMELHDEWLYISIGDGAAGAAHAHEPQKLRPDRGAILRYSINTGQWEPAAIGLRNPWTWTLHDDTFYIGDVGSQEAEEINVAPHAPWGDQGAMPNFGWPIYEGSECVYWGCEDLGYTKPVIEYRNEGGNSVIVGGMLDGELVWSDFFTGVIHYTDMETLETRTVETDYMPTSLLIHDGEVWVASIDGRVGSGTQADN